MYSTPKFPHDSREAHKYAHAGLTGKDVLFSVGVLAGLLALLFVPGLVLGAALGAGTAKGLERAAARKRLDSSPHSDTASSAPPGRMAAD